MIEERGMLVGLKLVFTAEHFEEIDQICQSVDTSTLSGLSELLYKVMDYINANMDQVNVYSSLLSDIVSEPELENRFVTETDAIRVKIDSDEPFDFGEFEFTVIVATADTGFAAIKPDNLTGLDALVNRLKTLSAHLLFGVEIFLLPIKDDETRKEENATQRKKPPRQERRPGREQDSH